jgi:menaquinone-9 beta-reductase
MMNPDLAAPELHIGSNATETVRNFDVAVVGASLAGCTAARLFALAGLRVALVEHHADTAAWKHLCTHYIQPSATPVLKRLGLDTLIEQAGGIRNGVDIWSRYGWVGNVAPFDEHQQAAYGYNIQRRTLDPLLRKLTLETPGVHAFFGCCASELTRLPTGAHGLRLRGAQQVELHARLIVGADGRNSPLAALAGIETHRAVNTRFGVIRAYRNVPLARGSCSQMWLRGPEIAYVFPNDGGVSIITYLNTKDDLAEFESLKEDALVRRMASFPDAPSLAAATPVGPMMIVRDFPNLWRDASRNNVALAGDAIMSVDPLWGVGCGFAFQTAAWLVDTLAPVLLANRPVAPALRRYARETSWKLAGHRLLILDFSRRRGFNPLERLLFAAAAKDETTSRHVHAFGARLIGPMAFLSPRALLRAAWINVRLPAARSAQTNAPV